ncbi:NAD(P)-binding protein [Aspergillus ellipticus CBS 707.79]|uniref:NAD(P)-binding protein n=1 Tax=Aspergillus ellipticus CBS 707.79 TaxID=1448320 RepID=A0A319DEK7_9EURO|nr:NAD(P)-binding protein [Aspergillus ellipticus CBS 707.79]
MRALIQPTAESKLDDLILTTCAVPAPNLDQHEHLIRVHACSPCAGELLWPLNFPPDPRELIPCPDVAGMVISAPIDSPFQPGAEVYARTNYSRPGNARDYTIAITDELAFKPQSLSWTEAAAVPVSAQTAWQILFVHAGIVPPEAEMDISKAREAWKGKRILVTGASGSVGMWVMQLARLLGVEAVGTCGPDNVALVEEMGAKEVLNYRTADLKKWSEEQDERKVDVVIDCIGRQSLQDAWWTVKEKGTVLSIVQPPGSLCPMASPDSIRCVFFVMQPSAVQLGEITRLIDEGKCRGMVDSVWPLEKFHQAFKRMDTGHARGKVILDIFSNE